MRGTNNRIVCSVIYASRRRIKLETAEFSVVIKMQAKRSSAGRYLRVPPVIQRVWRKAIVIPKR
jgi:hypothetical protein